MDFADRRGSRWFRFRVHVLLSQRLYRAHEASGASWRFKWPASVESALTACASGGNHDWSLTPLPPSHSPLKQPLASVCAQSAHAQHAHVKLHRAAEERRVGLDCHRERLQHAQHLPRARPQPADRRGTCSVQPKSGAV